ncbi:hypothetical protein QR680_016537 [Steinernema hermaphroditum]|uniref:Uncharacterized protein n=1 Tax=Steinernema hermaphroditum TaxID=289476 RepID=A0AA39LMH7_9BILA|nr:hypothetical protein QR680_016537 [Steinernema hermaphroditum]
MNRFAFVTLLLFGVAEAADDFLHGCSSHCQLSDSDLACWNKTNTFFERATLSLMRQYVNAQVRRVQYFQNHQMGVDYKQMGEETVGRWSKENPANIEDENGMTNAKLYKAVAGGLMEAVESQVQDLKGKAPKRVIRCPAGCEKTSRHWMWMFIGSAIVTGILTTLLVTIVCLLDYRDRKTSMLEEAKEMLSK